MKNSIIRGSDKRPSLTKKRLLSAMCFIAFTCACFAQDVIVTKDSKKIEAKVTEVNLDNVKYKIFDHQDGPVYTLPKGNIVSITYQNGLVDRFDTGSPAVSAPVQTTVSTSAQTAPAPAQTPQVRPLPPVNVLAEMRANYPALYSQYSSGKRMKTTGWILTGTGIGSFVVGLAMMGAGVEEDDLDLAGVGGVFFVASPFLIGAGVPILAVGGSKKRRALRSFNMQYHSSQTPSPHFQFNVYPNRVGLAYVF